MKSKVFILLFTVLCVVINMDREHSWKGKLFVWDKSGYHLYLPAITIYQDLGNLLFYPYINDKYKPSGTANWYCITDQPTGKKLNRYNIGVAFFELPFFLIAHLYTLSNKDYPPDGYSHPYEWGTIISTIFWVMIGLFYLRRFLKVYYSEHIVLFTLVCIALGTNLYHYTAFDQGMSHPYSFTMFAALLFYTDRWYTYYNKTDLWLLALAMGLITIIRPVNIIVVFIPLFWRVASIADIKNRLSLIVSKRIHFIVACLIFLLVALVQMSYWKYVSGHWLVYSYEGEHFNFLKPRIIDGLFSFRKGWFIYTPVAFISMIGLISLWKRDKKLTTTLFCFVALMIYITFSWWCWWYGGGFGARAMIECLAIMAIPLAALLDSVYKSTRLYYKAFISTVLLFFISLNMFQSYQYAKGIIDSDRMSRKYYWKVFGSSKLDYDKYKYLMSDEEYWEEMNK